MAEILSCLNRGTQPTTLWQILQNEASAGKLSLPFNIKEVMDDWTKKPGYPLLRVKRSYSQDNSAVISQVRSDFLPEGVHSACFLFDIRQQGFALGAKSTTNTALRWTIPFSYTSNFRETYNETLLNNITSMKIYLQGDQNKPVYFNALSAGK